MGLSVPRRICRYLYDEWLVDGILYVKVEAIQYERASEETFQLAARRRVEKWLESHGYEHDLLHGTLEVWDRSRDIANDLTTTITYRANALLPDDAAVA